MKIPATEWKWFGDPGHHIIGEDCRFHLCTQVGEFLISTVGNYLPDEGVREIIARTEGVTLRGMGDSRRADFLCKLGYQEVGAGRKFETYVFRVSGEACAEEECGRCGMPIIKEWSELRARGYNIVGDATRGHMEMLHELADTAPELGLLRIERSSI